MLPAELRSHSRPPLRAVLAWTAATAGIAFALGPHWGGAFAAGAESTRDRQVRGEQVYALTCAACHGPVGEGRLGDPTADGPEAGPPVRGLEVAYVDQLLRTGRMPIRENQVGVNVDELRREEREAAIAWMTKTFDLVGAVPEVGEGDRARGHELYGIHCSACHGATGQGGIGAGGTSILGVTGVDATAVVEAIRVGPFDMPRFDEGSLSPEDADAIAAFVAHDLSRPDRTAIGLGEMHRVTFWAVASLVAVALLALVVLVARPVRNRPAPAPVETEPETRGGGAA